MHTLQMMENIVLLWSRQSKQCKQLQQSLNIMQEMYPNGDAENIVCSSNMNYLNTQEM